METLSAWLSHQETHPGVTQLLFACLNAWQRHQEIHFPVPQIPALKIAYLDHWLV
jgi:hypothetical protein